MRTKAPERLPIFRSDLQARLLGLLLGSVGGELSVAELQQRVGGSRAGVHQELRRLLDAGILERRSVGRANLYRAAEESPLVAPLRTLVERTVGVEADLRERLDAIPGIDAAAIHGSWAHSTQIRPLSDVDVLVIGRPDRDELERAIRRVEQTSGREVDLSLYDPEDWARRLREGSGFAHTIATRPIIPLIGEVPLASA
jgi:DNA-binding transcriptional ArsR family regulator